MIVLIDTNIILDVLIVREPFYRDSLEILRLAERKEINSYITSNSITDIMYILRKYLKDIQTREEAIYKLLQFIEVVTVGRNEILKALQLHFSDFEDALQLQCARKIKADYIITRNINNFKELEIRAITPEEFLNV